VLRRGRRRHRRGLRARAGAARAAARQARNKWLQQRADGGRRNRPEAGAARNGGGTRMSSNHSNAERSRFPEFYKLSVADRVRLMRERGWLSEADYQALVSGSHTLQVSSADK